MILMIKVAWFTVASFKLTTNDNNDNSAQNKDSLRYLVLGVHRPNNVEK